MFADSGSKGAQEDQCLPLSRQFCSVLQIQAQSAQAWYPHRHPHVVMIHLCSKDVAQASG